MLEEICFEEAIERMNHNRVVEFESEENYYY
jgi:hypothetical protein